MKKLGLIFTTLFMLSACGGMPTHSTSTANQSAQISIENAPIGAALIVDNRQLGVVTKKRSTFKAPTGTHRVRIITENGAILFDGDIYLTKNITREIPVS